MLSHLSHYVLPKSIYTENHKSFHEHVDAKGIRHKQQGTALTLRFCGIMSKSYIYFLKGGDENYLLS